MLKIKKTAIPVYALQTGFFVSDCIMLAYFTPVLYGAGWSDSAVGTLYGVTGLVSLVLQPLLGFICDRFNSYRMLTCFGIAQFGVALFVFFASPGKIAAAALLAVSSGIGQSVIGILENWQKKLSDQGCGFSFPVMRGYGSAVYAVGSLAVGRLMGLWGDGCLRWLMLASLAVMGAAALFVRNPEPETESGGVALGEAIRYLAHHREYVTFVVCMLLAQVAGQSLASFMPIALERLGGGNAELGMMYFIGTAAEAVGMLLLHRPLKKYGAAAMMDISFLGYALRTAAIAIAPSVPLMYCANLMQAISYGISLPVWVIYLFEIVEPRYVSTATLLSMSLTYGLAAMFGAGYGALSEAIGVRGMLLLMTIPALAGTVIFAATSVRRARKKRA